MKRRVMLITLTALALGLATMGPASWADVDVRGPAAPAAQMGTAFTYQGRLIDDGGPADGDYDFEFGLFDVDGGGSALGTTALDDVAVIDGLFSVQLDFGEGAFVGEARWPEIGVRPGDSAGAYTTLEPRQPLTPAPYALALPGLWTRQNAESPNLIGGHHLNNVWDGVVGGTIGGGGQAGDLNGVTDRLGTVAGGADNQAGNGDGDVENADGATVGGGWHNSAYGAVSVVGGGAWNRAEAYASTVGGGEENHASLSYATISGGEGNRASGGWSTIGGGYANVVSDTFGTIAGGSHNSASGEYSIIGGGVGNTASGYRGTIGGGVDNRCEG